MRTGLMRTLIAMMCAGVASGVAWAGNNGQGKGPQCDLDTLRGSYVFTASGFNIVGGVAQPKALIELLEFYGDGALGVTGGTVSINGTITQIVPTGTGTYTLGPDCNGTLSFIGGPSSTLFVERDGENGWMFQTNANTVFQGTLTQRR